MFYQVKPVDQLFFRSSAPFEGTQLFASQFPPLPSTYGGVFQMLAKGMEQRKRLRLSYNGVVLTHKNGFDFCFPQPLDTLCLEKEIDISETDLAEKKKKQVVLETMRLKPRPHSNLHKHLPLCLVPKNLPNKNDSDARIYIKKDVLKAYLSGDMSQAFEQETSQLFNLDDYLLKERKIGIGTDSETGRVKESQLYQIGMVRPVEGLQLVAEASSAFKGEEMLTIEQDFIKLGGEGKTVQIEKTDLALSIKSKIVEKEVAEEELDYASDYFKLYFATPAIFANGWFPRWLREEKEGLIGSFSHKGKKVEFRLIAAAVGKPEAVGGFDPYKNEPKELRYAIPAGSVYYFQVMGNTTLKDIKKLFHQKCLSDYREGIDKINNEPYQFNRPKIVFDRLTYCDRGFGYALVGAVDKNMIKELEEVCLRIKD